MKKIKKKRGKKNAEVSGNFWFRKRAGLVSRDAGWGWIPIRWEGWVALGVLIGINVFAAQYFDLANASFKQGSSFGVVFLLSLFVFIEIAQRKTRGIKVGK